MTMSIPQKMLMIHPTIMTAVRIWMRAAATLSQNTQHTPLSAISSLRAPHSTVNAETKVPATETEAKRKSWAAQFIKKKKTKVITAEKSPKQPHLSLPCIWLCDICRLAWLKPFKVVSPSGSSLVSYIKQLSSLRNRPEHSDENNSPVSLKSNSQQGLELLDNRQEVFSRLI